MQHETKMKNQSWLKKLARRLGPGHIVNLCFIVVLLFSTLLTWREVVVLEDAYISSQRNHLENVANALDKLSPTSCRIHSRAASGDSTRGRRS